MQHAPSRAMPILIESLYDLESLYDRVYHTGLNEAGPAHARAAACPPQLYAVTVTALG